MNEHHEPATAENPFCSRRIRPGALPFILPENENPTKLVKRLRRNGWWGQILGPHGSGKSALLAALVPVVERAGRQTFVVELHDGQRRLPFDVRGRTGSGRSTVLIIDGYEQLSRFSRFRIKRFCRRGGWGLLVTAHVSVGLPELFCTTPDLHLAQRIVEQLQHGHPTHVTVEDVGELFTRHAANLREMLFALYDLYEQRRRGESTEGD